VLAWTGPHLGDGGGVGLRASTPRPRPRCARRGVAGGSLATPVPASVNPPRFEQACPSPQPYRTCLRRRACPRPCSLRSPDGCIRRERRTDDGALAAPLHGHHDERGSPASPSASRSPRTSEESLSSSIEKKAAEDKRGRVLRQAQLPSSCSGTSPPDNTHALRVSLRCLGARRPPRHSRTCSPRGGLHGPSDFRGVAGGVRYEWRRSRKTAQVARTPVASRRTPRPAASPR